MGRWEREEGEEMGRREGGREEGGKTNLAVDLETCGPTTQQRRGLDNFIHNPFVDRVCCLLLTGGLRMLFVVMCSTSHDPHMTPT